MTMIRSIKWLFLDIGNFIHFNWSPWINCSICINILWSYYLQWSKLLSWKNATYVHGNANIHHIHHIQYIVFKCKHKSWFIADVYIVVTLHGYQSILSLSISKNKNNHDDHKCIHMNLCYLYLYKHAPNILHSNQPWINLSIFTNIFLIKQTAMPLCRYKYDQRFFSKTCLPIFILNLVLY